MVTEKPALVLGFCVYQLGRTSRCLRQRQGRQARGKTKTYSINVQQEIDNLKTSIYDHGGTLTFKIWSNGCYDYGQRWTVRLREQE